ncbi:MAG TPA: hypothetical protein P5265_00605 [Bacteroidia bacterium]|nr:hypothetical protein [Sphingobacteriales bacterium]HPD64377.1 hypothetical protein [Bacteroidia bacterium]HRU66973.1 hypothetical protein [Bacteroidia bacterium]
MNIRILHCGDNLRNYYLCAEHRVAGFSGLSPARGDLIYLAVKFNGISYIGAKGVIDDPTNDKPWPDASKYKYVFRLKDVEYCKPFEIQPLSKFGGSYWAAKFLQASKPIKVPEATLFLENEFVKNHTEALVKF